MFVPPNISGACGVKIFGNNNPVHIEIGMGKGRFLTELARLLVKLFVFLMRGYSEFMEIDSGESVTDPTGYTDSESYDIWNLIFFVVVIALIIIFRRQIWQTIKSFFGRIIGFFSKETALSEAEPEFVDVFEQISDTRQAKDLSYSALMKRYKKESNPVTKYRLGYGVLLWQMKYCKAKLTASDTVTDQYEKGREVLGAELKEITAAYDKLRYDGASVTAEQLSKLDNLIRSASAMVKGNI